MGIGYIFGCLLSIILWKLNRQAFFKYINMHLNKLLKKDALIYIVYAVFTAFIIYISRLINNSELNNFITALLVIDISCTERENLNKKEKFHFYDSISTISRAIVCGFMAPLFYIALFGNIYGILYMLIYNFSNVSCDNNLLKDIVSILNIIPCAFVEMLLYLVYIARNKKLKIDFKGDFSKNFIKLPLLNVDILAAYLECVNFYYHYSSKQTDYIKSYGNYNKKVDEYCIKDYLGIAYGVCLVIFIIYFVVYVLK